MRGLWTSLAALVLGAALLSTAGCSQAEPVPGDADFDPLSQSSAAESVVRTARLAGYDSMASGLDKDRAFVLLGLPALNSAADVEIAWQTGVAALASSYPSADEYLVRIATDRDMLEVIAQGDEAREAVEADDPVALRAASSFVYLGESVGGWNLPAEVYDATYDKVLHYLDQKNRSNGLAGEEGLLIPQADELSSAAVDARESVPGVPAVEASADAGRVWAQRTTDLLVASQAEGTQELGDALYGMSASRESVSRAREWFHIASAVESDVAYGSVLGLVSDYAPLTRESEVTEGPQADAILVAYGDRSAPSSARVVDEFDRVPSADTDGSGESDVLPDHVMEANGGDGAVIAYVVPSGTQVVDADEWLAYDRPDGTRFWLAGEDGLVALTDGSLIGWAFERSEAALVDALNVGSWLEVFPTR